MGPEHTYLLAKMVADGLNMLGRDSGIDPSTHVCGIGKGDGWAQHSSYIAENGGGRAQRKYVLGKPVYLVSAKGTGGPKLCVCTPENGDGCVQHVCCMPERGYGWTIRHPWRER
jgi:hypothetical protein